MAKIVTSKSVILKDPSHWSSDRDGFVSLQFAEYDDGDSFSVAVELDKAAVKRMVARLSELLEEAKADS